MKYAFIKSHKNQYPIETMCRVLQASRSGYYDWCKSRVSRRKAIRTELIHEIKQIHEESRGTYGSPRVLEELKGKGWQVNHKTVERIMQENGLQSKTRKKFKQTTDSNHKLPVAPNLLDRAFTMSKPNLVWVSDITYLPTDEGWLYLATFIDLFSRKVVGWSMSSRMTADLVVDALKMGVSRNKKSPLMVHSDRGSQYARRQFRDELGSYRCMRSMSAKGDCWDNGVPRMHTKGAVCRRAA